MNQLRKSKRDKVISGECGGTAEFLGVPSILGRLIFIMIPVSVLVYALLAFFLHEDNKLY